MTNENQDTGDKEEDEEAPSRAEAEGRGQGNGTWLEQRVAKTLEEWGYRTKTGESLLGLEADVIARREEIDNEPEDFLVVECKDWATRLIGEEVIIRLCLVAFLGRAMPVLCHTTHLTDRAWHLAQLLDVRLITREQLSQYDDLPPLTTHRPPYFQGGHRKNSRIEHLRDNPPVLLTRTGSFEQEAPVFSGPAKGPCYVTDRTGHEEYVSGYK